MVGIIDELGVAYGLAKDAPQFVASDGDGDLAILRGKRTVFWRPHPEHLASRWPEDGVWGRGSEPYTQFIDPQGFCRAADDLRASLKYGAQSPRRGSLQTPGGIRQCHWRAHCHLVLSHYAGKAYRPRIRISANSRIRIMT